MKVSELITILQAQNPDTMVVRSAYTEGFLEVTNVSQILLTKNPNESWMVGPYTESEVSAQTVAILLT